MKTKNYTLLTFAALFLNLAGFAQPVIPDSTFNGTGRRVFSLGGTLDFGDNVAVQSDGKIVMSGATFFGGQAKLGMVRFNADGSFDPDFGTAGISIIDLGNLGYQGGFEPEIVIRPDGKIIVCGFCQDNGSDDMFVCRLLPNGQLDNTFGTGGRVAVDMLGTNSMPDAAYTLTADVAGNIYACGATRTGGTPFTNDLAIIKLTPSGELDPSFSGDGKLLLDLTGSWDFGYGIAVQIDNKIIVTGYAGLPANFFAVRLLPNGDYDPSYSGDGKVFIDIFGLNVADEAWGMRMGPDEKVYIVGDGYNSAISEFQTALVRLTTSGDPDPSFGTNGIATFDILPGQNESFKDVIVLANGQCLVGGSVGTNSQDFAIFRMNQDGTLDMNFNNTGSYTVDVTGLFKNDLGYGMALQSDGKILLSGNTSFIDAVNEKYSIMRVAPNGVLAGFTASASLICEGSSVQFTNTSVGEGLSYQWTFEGGTPPTSTAQNPSVTYSYAGTYDVKLKVYNLDFADSLIITNMIEVIAIPAIPASPFGPSMICNQQIAQCSIAPVQFATSYSWQLIPSSAGMLVANGTSATFTAAPSWTWTYAISVKAVNQCGSSSWSEALNGTVYHLPLAYTLEGDGAYCEGSSGATLTLSSSETGVDYQLYLDAVASGAFIPGTGYALTWQDLTAVGFYTVKAITANCVNDMAGQIYVTPITAPVQPSTPEGPAISCNNQVPVYTVQGTVTGDVIVWTLTPSGAGVLSPSGISVSIAWTAGFAGAASLSVQAQNQCGNSPQSSALAITVNANPSPAVSGPLTVCEGWISNYQTLNNPGSTYSWNVTGGTIIGGAGTSIITVLWGTPGNATIAVSETNSASCIGASQVLNVDITVCIGVAENKYSQAMQVFPNPAHDNLTVVFNTQLTEDHTLRLSDAMGRVVLEQKISSGSSSSCLNISSLSNGYYTLSFMNKGNVVVQEKILKH